MSFSEGMLTMAIARFSYGVIFGFSLPITTAYLTEITVLKYRGKCITSMNFFVTLGIVWGCVLAYFCLDTFDEGDWRLMMRLSCIPAVIDCILIYYFLDESSRFLLLTRNYDQAFNVIDKMITMNNSQEKEVLDDNDKVRLVEWKEKYFLEHNRGSYKALFSNDYKLLTVRLLILWVTNIIMYFG